MIKVLEVMMRARDDNTTTIADAETAKVGRLLRQVFG
jgi:hypothetical protein